MGRHTRHSRAAAGSGWIRLRALLAGGLVLGVGGTLTLAAWTDQEVVQATFTAGTFDLVGSADGTTFSSHLAGSPAPLTFAPVSTAMLPGQTVYSAFSVKTAPGSTSALVTPTAAGTNNTGLGAYLTYQLVRVTARTSCTAAGISSGTVVVAAGSPLTTGGTEQLAVSGAGAQTVNYCFAITLPTTAPNAAQGMTLNATWTFAGTAG
ncbi:SipW-dependent-type signal peptide-containing protein [Mycetocola sp. JXN-3]|uniref:SipW-dependent-type signal peptide-containing protein n=1 Tax=Mycetocola sp. JXN-3 TaxID=2116510 RepID=UPI00165CF6FC|nr:SipW-dependent-type signal peptide-containing protein [Mycetocola sp. JXN-3]